MANRNLTTDQVNYNNNQSVVYYDLLYIRTRESGTANYDYTYITNAPYDIRVTAAQASSMGLEPAASQKFLAVGNFLQFSVIEESADFQITSMTIGLAGMRSSDLNLFLSNQYIDQPVKIWRVWFDTSGQMVGDPVLIFSGNIDKPVVTDDPDSGVTIGCSASSQWITYTRTAGRHTNNDEQVFFYPGDTIFKFSADAIKDLKWGG